VQALRSLLTKRVSIIEDAAHAFGARFANGKPVGSSGNPTCFSFYANKNLSTGEGGAVALSDRRQAERLQSLRQHALPLDAWKRFTHAKSLLLSNPLRELGYKMNYTDLQASIGRVQLARQGELDSIRLDIARRYTDGLKEVSPLIKLQREITHPYHARHLFVLQLPLEQMRMRRDEVLLALREKNIGVSIHYAPLHLMPLYRGRSKPARLPATERIAKRIMTLPISASMTLADADDVIEQFKAEMK
jgi:dTDP-4-amino-4,6-dideoxygalactose transaminase